MWINSGRPVPCSTTDLPAMTRLQVVLKVKQLMDAAEASVTVELAHDNDWDEDSEYDMEGLRPIRIGSDGTQPFPRTRLRPRRRPTILGRDFA